MRIIKKLKEIAVRRGSVVLRNWQRINGVEKGMGAVEACLSVQYTQRPVTGFKLHGGIHAMFFRTLGYDGFTCLYEIADPNVHILGCAF